MGMNKRPAWSSDSQIGTLLIVISAKQHQGERIHGNLMLSNCASCMKDCWINGVAFGLEGEHVHNKSTYFMRKFRGSFAEVFLTF